MWKFISLSGTWRADILHPLEVSSLLALLQHFSHVLPLQLFKFHAVRNPLQALLQRAFSAGGTVVGKKLFDLIPHCSRAESAQCRNGAAAAKGCDFFRQRVPMCLEILPGNLTRG